MRSLELRSEDLEAIQRHAGAAYPAECCGILLGLGSRVYEVRSTENGTVHDPRGRYEIPVRELLEAQREARERELEVIGYYHSHPDHPARPSERDRAEAWPGVSYLIVGVERGTAGEVTSWRLGEAEGGFEPQPVEVCG